MLGLSCELRSVAFHTMLWSSATFGNTLHICNRDDDNCGFTCTVAESQKLIHRLLFPELRLSVKCGVTLRPGVWRTAVEAELLALPTADSRRGLKICDGQESRASPTQSWPSHCQTGDRNLKKNTWHCWSTVVSTFILHDNTAGEILMFCNSSNSELCLCDISVPRTPPPHSRSQPPDRGTRGESHHKAPVLVALESLTASPRRPFPPVK